MDNMNCMQRGVLSIQAEKQNYLNKVNKPKTSLRIYVVNKNGNKINYQNTHSILDFCVNKAYQSLGLY